MPAKFKIIKLFTREGIGLVVFGRVLSGSFRAGEKGRTCGKDFYVLSIGEEDRLKQAAREGEELSLWLRGINPDDISSGSHLFF